jgi:methyl-accepting chemotaxis protein
MNEDPRKPIIAVMARLGRETQLHLDERYRHFRVTDAVIIAISLVLVVTAVFNVYYVRVVYKDLDGIVRNMDSMYGKLVAVDDDMTVISDRFAAVTGHIGQMSPINAHVAGLAQAVPSVREDMGDVAGSMTRIEGNMRQLARSMGAIDVRVQQMTGGVAVMRENVVQIARPMGKMNPFMP